MLKPEVPKVVPTCSITLWPGRGAGESCVKLKLEPPRQETCGDSFIQQTCVELAPFDARPPVGCRVRELWLQSSYSEVPCPPLLGKCRQEYTRQS